MSGPVESTFVSRARNASRATDGAFPFTERVGAAGGAANGEPLNATVNESIVVTAAKNFPAKKLSVLRSNARLMVARALSSTVVVDTTRSRRM